MIDIEIKKKIQELKNKGLSKRKIAAGLGLSRPTVTKYWHDAHSGDYVHAEEDEGRIIEESLEPEGCESDEEIERPARANNFTESKLLRQKLRAERLGRQLANSKNQSGERQAIAIGLSACLRLKHCIQTEVLPGLFVDLGGQDGQDQKYLHRRNISLTKLYMGVESIEKFLDGCLATSKPTALAAARCLKKAAELEFGWQGLCDSSKKNNEVLEIFDELSSALRVLIEIGI